MLRTALLFAVVLAAFGGTAYAAFRVMDSTPSPETLRAQRAARNAVLAHNARKAQAAARSKRARPAAKRRARPGRRWAARADAACDRTYADAWDLVDRSSVQDAGDFLRLLEDTVRLGDLLLVQLERLGPAPNRKAYARLTATLRTGQEADRRALASLRARWDPVAFQRHLQASVRTSERLRRLALGVGSAGCAQLFDPATL